QHYAEGDGCRAVVEQALRFNENQQSSMHLRLSKDGNHRHRIGSGDENAKGECAEPLPLQQKMHACRRDCRGEHDAHRSKHNNNRQIPPHLIPMQIKGCFKQQRRQQCCKDQILGECDPGYEGQKSKENACQKKAHTVGKPHAPGEHRHNRSDQHQDCSGLKLGFHSAVLCSSTWPRRLPLRSALSDASSSYSPGRKGDSLLSRASARVSKKRTTASRSRSGRVANSRRVSLSILSYIPASLRSFVGNNLMSRLRRSAGLASRRM